MRHTKVASIVVGLTITLGLTTVALSAQGSGENPLVAALQAVETTLGELVSAVNNLDTAEGNVRITPLLDTIPPESVQCLLTNVSDGDRMLHAQLINGSGQVVSEGTDTVPPNQTRFLETADGEDAFCKITVVNGVKSDVRGVISVRTSSNGLSRDPVPAQ